MKYTGYAATAGACLVLSVTISQWFALGTAAAGLMAYWSFYRQQRRERQG